MKRQQIIATLRAQKDLLRRYSIDSIHLFGSVAKDAATDASDVDLLVAFRPEARIGFFQFTRLRRELSHILQCDVDLATPEALHKEFKADILNEAIRAA